MILGIDISHWQGEFDWQKAKDEGIKFAFIRAGSIRRDDGVCYEDYQFHRNSEEGPKYMPCAYYWYFRPKWDWKKQADYFQNLISTKEGFGAVGDFEDAEGVNYTRACNRMALFMNELKFGEPIIYTRGTWWNGVCGNAVWAANYDLWIARYNNLLQHPWGDGKYKPKPWNEWTFWQFTSKGDGQKYGAQSLDLDMNYFNGTQAEFDAYVGNVPPEAYTVQINVPNYVQNFIIEVHRT